jgi:L-ascorbate metabolism protein UlaG (beta-lactamase superfamily)
MEDRFMVDEINITWHGHSCFTVEAGKYCIVLDPFADGAVPGYADIRLTANEVICSHEHRDHGFREGVTLTEGPDNPFAVESIKLPHDDAGGSLRGMNEITILSAGGMRVAHFGDIGCMPEPEALRKLTGLDLAMIPVGGYYTMEPEGVLSLLEQIKPKVVIPMHYRTEAFGYEVLHTLDDFLSERDVVIEYDSNRFTLTPDTPAQTAVLRYMG